MYKLCPKRLPSYVIIMPKFKMKFFSGMWFGWKSVIQVNVVDYIAESDERHT